MNNDKIPLTSMYVSSRLKTKVTKCRQKYIFFDTKIRGVIVIHNIIDPRAK